MTYTEEIASGGLKVSMPLKGIYFEGKSDFQQVHIIETWFGKTLVTDGMHAKN